MFKKENANHKIHYNKALQEAKKISKALMKLDPGSEEYGEMLTKQGKQIKIMHEAYCFFSNTEKNTEATQANNQQRARISIV